MKLAISGIEWAIAAIISAAIFIAIMSMTGCSAAEGAAVDRDYGGPSDAYYPDGGARPEPADAGALHGPLVLDCEHRQRSVQTAAENGLRCLPGTD